MFYANFLHGVLLFLKRFVNKNSFSSCCLPTACAFCMHNVCMIVNSRIYLWECTNFTCSAYEWMHLHTHTHRDTNSLVCIHASMHTTMTTAIHVYIRKCIAIIQKPTHFLVFMLKTIITNICTLLALQLSQHSYSDTVGRHSRPHTWSVHDE